MHLSGRGSLRILPGEVVYKEAMRGGPVYAFICLAFDRLYLNWLVSEPHYMLYGCHSPCPRNLPTDPVVPGPPSQERAKSDQSICTMRPRGIGK